MKLRVYSEQLLNLATRAITSQFIERQSQIAFVISITERDILHPRWYG